MHFWITKIHDSNCSLTSIEHEIPNCIFFCHDCNPTTKIITTLSKLKQINSNNPFHNPITHVLAPEEYLSIQHFSKCSFWSTKGRIVCVIFPFGGLHTIRAWRTRGGSCTRWQTPPDDGGRCGRGDWGTLDCPPGPVGSPCTPPPETTMREGSKSGSWLKKNHIHTPNRDVTPFKLGPKSGPIPNGKKWFNFPIWCWKTPSCIYILNSRQFYKAIPKIKIYQREITLNFKDFCCVQFFPISLECQSQLFSQFIGPLNAVPKRDVTALIHKQQEAHWPHCSPENFFIAMNKLEMYD